MSAVAGLAGFGAIGRGLVVEFDETVGLGTVRDDSGAELSFHCVEIADGSRTIAVGEAVRYVVRPGLPGRWEAQALTPA